MSRPLRLEFPDALYHITSRGDRGEDIYEDTTDRKAFLEILSLVITRFNWVCYAYCLMDNHYHLLIQTPDGNLSKGMRHLNGVYTQFYNRRHRKTGHLYQGRYKAILVDQDSYLLELSRYIVLNPVKAGIVERVAQWPWSSYSAMTGISESHEWLTIDFLLSQFATRRKTAIKRYIAFVEAGVKNGPIWSQVNNQIYLGDSDFVERAQQHLTDQKDDIQIPKKQRRSVVMPLSEYEKQTNSRNEAIVKAYASGGYSYQKIGDYFRLHFTRVGRIVRTTSRQAKS
jgi:REP element-mobilizing transposase RayT